MERSVLAFGAAVLVGVLAATGLWWGLGSPTTDVAAPTLGQLQALDEALDAVRDDMAGARKELQILKDKVTELAIAQEELVRSQPPPPRVTADADAPAAGEDGAAHAGPYAPGTPQFKELVFALIAEERALAQQEQRRREEELRRQREELSQGPYGQFNLKVNSLSKALGLDDAQRQQYYETTKKAWDELSQLRQKTDWRDRAARDAYRESSEALEKQFSGSVEGLFTPDQLAAYRELPAWARSPQNMGWVPPPGEDPGPYMRYGSSLRSVPPARGRSEGQGSGSGVGPDAGRP
jgi:hypothetical protein